MLDVLIKCNDKRAVADLFTKMKVTGYVDTISYNTLLKGMGAGLDWDAEYFTLDRQRSGAVVEAFVRLHEAGLVRSRKESRGAELAARRHCRRRLRRLRAGLLRRGGGGARSLPPNHRCSASSLAPPSASSGSGTLRVAPRRVNAS